MIASENIFPTRFFSDWIVFSNFKIIENSLCSFTYFSLKLNFVEVECYLLAGFDLFYFPRLPFKFISEMLSINYDTKF